MKRKNLTFKEIEKSSKDNPIAINEYYIKNIWKYHEKYPKKYIFTKGICEKCSKKFTRQIRNLPYTTLPNLYLCRQCNTVESNIKNFGCENVFQRDDVKEDIKEKVNVRYGGFTMQSKELKEKVKKTNQERYGVDWTTQSKQMKEKSKITSKKHWGTEYPSQSEKIKEKIKQTNLNNLGVEYPMQSEKVKEKSKDTCLEKYDVDVASKSDKIKKKIKTTNLTNHNGIWNSQTDEYLDKRRNTLQENFGVDSPLQSKELSDKYKKTCLDRYGVDNPAKSEEIKIKVKNTNIDKYGKLHFTYKYKYKRKYFDSSWELAFYIYHKDKKHKIEKGNVNFSYVYNKEIHYYEPDFKIGKKYYEIKGEQFIKRYKNGNVKTLICPYDKSLNKLYAAKYKCMKKNMVIIITSKEIKKYLNYINKYYGKSYLDKFKI